MCLYRRGDQNKDGELGAREFARMFDVEASNPFLERLVALFDVSGDGMLSPLELIACLSHFTNSARTNRGEHVRFAWRLFDTNDDGSISKAEFREVLRATYFRESGGEGTDSNRRVIGDGGMRRGRGLANFGGTGGMAKGLDNIIRDVDGGKDGRVTVREFSRMTRDYPHVIAPAFDLWTKLGEVGRPAVRARREIEEKGNDISQLVALATESSETRRAAGDARASTRGEWARGPACRRDDATTTSRPADPRVNTHTRRQTRRQERDAATAATAATTPVPVSRRRGVKTSPPQYISATTDAETLANKKIPKVRTSSSWRLPSFSSPRTPPPPKTSYELEMEAACASTDEEAGF